MHNETLATYDQLASTTNAIAKRLGSEVAPGLAELNAQHAAIADNVTAFEQSRHLDLYQPIADAAARLGGQILAATTNLGRNSGN